MRQGSGWKCNNLKPNDCRLVISNPISSWYRLVLAPFCEGLRALLGERRLVEEFVGEAGIVLASVVEGLNGAASVMLARDLQWGPDAVLQMVVGVDGDVFVDLLGFFVLGRDGTPH